MLHLTFVRRSLPVLMLIGGIVSNLTACQQTVQKEGDDETRVELEAHINSLVVRHHPDLKKEGSYDPRSDTALFDFLIDKRRSEFPVLFADDSRVVTIAEAENRYSNQGIDVWMEETQADYEDRLRFDVFRTKLGLLIGDKSNREFLVLAQSGDLVVAWKLFVE